MDRKPQTQPQKYPMQKNYNRNYISEFKIDNDNIDTTYSNFSSGEYDTIIKIIEGNEILNFRNTKGETLIHAILKNPSSSLNESLILDIIQKLVHKNVSINAMNEYNQIPLHLAAKSGYYDIIDYLISLKSDFNKIDNYGNAPVHYLIDNFVIECKESDYFKQSNKKMKKSLKVDKYEQIVDKYLILSLVEEIEKNKGTRANELLLKLRDVVKKYKFFKVTEINKIIDDKKLKIDNLYKAHSSSSLEPDIKNILFESVTELNNVYKDLNFENKLDKKGESEIINDNTMNDINKYVTEEKIKCAKEFNDKINKLKSNVDAVRNSISNISVEIYKLFKILYLCFYIRITSYSLGLNPNLNTNINNTSVKIIEYFYSPESVNFYDFEKLVDNTKIINNFELEKFIKFIRSFATVPFYLPHTGPWISEIQKLPLGLDIDPAGSVVIWQHYDDSHIDSSFIIELEFIRDSMAASVDPNFTGQKCKLTTLLNILTYCEEYMKILDNLNLIDTIESYPYLYLNYINEIIINITNNLVIFKKEYEKLKINNILYDLTSLSSYIGESNCRMYGLLFAQLNWFTNTDIYNLTDPKQQKELENINKSPNAVMNDLTQNLNNNSMFGTINDLYKKILDINIVNNNFIESVNKHYSLKYLESFVELYKKDVLDTTTKIDNFFINKFYPINSNFPTDLSSYQNKYFQEYKFDISSLRPIKKDLLKKYYSYDFNRLFNTNDYQTVTLEFDYLEINIDKSNPDQPIFIQIPTKFEVNFDENKYSTGHSYTIYTTIPDTVDNEDIFTIYKPTNLIIDKGDNLKWLKTDNYDFVVFKNPIPIISLDNAKKIIQTFGFKITRFIETNINSIIINTKTKLGDSDIPKKIKDNMSSSFDYLLRPENETLAKKVIIEKLIIFMNSYIKIQINEEINDLLSNITDKFITEPLKKLNTRMIKDVKAQYEVQLKKYTLNTMIPELLKRTKVNTLGAIYDALIGIDSGSLAKSNERKLLVNKCVVNNKVDALKDKLSGKINLRILDRNGNTILNRLIDQYNEYAISKVLELDPEIYTWQNNRGQNSIDYLFDVISSIDKAYTWEALDKRIEGYESDLQVWIKAEGSFEDIELDENKHMIYNLILNSLYLFNESLWLTLLKAPNGWKYEDKINLKKLIFKMNKYNIKENLLIKSLTDEDKKTFKANLEIGSLNKKINEIIKEVENDIKELTNTNIQLEEEKKTPELVEIPQLDSLISENKKLITDKENEIINLKSALLKTGSFDTRIDKIFKEVANAKLIDELSIDWDKYNELIRDHIFNYYLPTIKLVNEKNKNSTEKYMSFYNYGLLNLNNKLLDDSDIKLLINYNTKIINNIYGDYYDLDKYEDSEYNYINHNILNIIYLNVINVIGIEMFSALTEYLANKYTSNKKITEVLESYDNTTSFVLFDIIKNLLKNCVWDKLGSKNPDKVSDKKYPEDSFYINDLKSNIKILFNLLDNTDDDLTYDKIIKFYKGLCEHIAYNINNEIINYLNDLKKHSLLFGILDLIKKKK